MSLPPFLTAASLWTTGLTTADGVAIVWCMVQVTLVATATLALYGLIPTRGRGLRRGILSTACLLVLGLSLMTFSPWPVWRPGSGQWTAGSGQQGTGTGFDVASSKPVTRTIKLEPAPANADSKLTPQTSDLVREFSSAFLAELRNPREVSASPAIASSSSSIGPQSRGSGWPSVVGLVVLGLASVGMLRLLLGLLAVAWYRSRSSPIFVKDLLELRDVLLAELCGRGTVELRESSRLSSAAALGWRRPVILLPADWRSWTTEELRAVLAHEIAHVRHADFLSCLGAQLALALHFYHPLVHWLAGRLRLELELAADAAAAAVSGGAETYVQTLARLALREADRPLGWPARTFLPTQGTLLRRIEMLRGPNPFPKPPSRTSRLAVATLLLLIGIGAAGFRSLAADPPPQPPAAAGAGNLEAPPPVAQVDQNAPPQGGSPQPQAPDSSTPGQQGHGVSRTVEDEHPTAGGAGPTPPVRDASSIEFAPPNTMAVINVRVDRLFANPALRKVQPEILALFSKDLKISPAEIEQITLLYVSPLADQPASGMAPLAVITLRSPTAAAQFTRELGKPELRTDDDVEYMVTDTGVAWKMARPRSVALGTPAGVVNLFRHRNTQRSHLVRVAPAGVYDEDVMIALQTSWLRAFRAEIPRSSPVLLATTAYASLWEDAQTIYLGASFKSDVHVSGFLVCQGEPAAERAHESLQAGSDALVSLMARLRKTPPDPAYAQLAQFWEPLEGLLRTGKIEARANIVHYRTTTPLNADLLTPALNALSAMKKAVDRSVSINNLRQLGVAFHNYHDTFGRFPSAVMMSDTGVPYSWRIAIAPYVGGARIYNAYKFDQPWDGPDNRKLLDQMPPVFRAASPAADQKDAWNTGYFMLTGDRVLGRDHGKGTTMAEILDGTSNTLLLVEAVRDVPWMKPEDIPLNLDDPQKHPRLGGYYTGGYHALFADASVRFFSEKLPPDTFRAMSTFAGLELVTIPNR